MAGLLTLLLSACGGGGSGAQCTLTAEELDNLTPADVDSLPAACDGISFFEVPAIIGLFILGTEVDGGSGELKLYVHGVKQNGEPMTIADFEQAVLTGGGTAFNRPDDWDVAAVADGSILSMVTLADYSTSITDADLAGMGDLYDVVLNDTPAGFEAEQINFSSLGGAMGTALMGPLADRFDPFADTHGLVERSTPASLLITQTDGQDNSSLAMTQNELTALIDRCHTTTIMLGTFRSEVDAQVLDDLAGTRGIAVNALNTNFLEEAIKPYAASLGNLGVFTVSPATLFAGKTVSIDVGGITASEVEPFDIDGSCQLLP